MDGPDGRGRGSLADAPPDSRPPVGRATELRTVEELLTRASVYAEFVADADALAEALVEVVKERAERARRGTR